jgi:hypothetical protein
MFRAIKCSSSGGQIVCIQHMVSPLSVSDRGGRAVPKLEMVWSVEDKSSYEAFSSRFLRVEIIYRMQLSVVTRSKMSNFTVIVIFQGMLRLLSFYLNCVLCNQETFGKFSSTFDVISNYCTVKPRIQRHLHFVPMELWPEICCCTVFRFTATVNVPTKYG